MDEYSIAFWAKIIQEGPDYVGVFRRADDLDSAIANIEIYYSSRTNELILVHNRFDKEPYHKYEKSWSLSEINITEWHHIVVAWSNSVGWNVYVNGVLSEERPSFGSFASPKTGGYSYIGTAYGGQIFNDDHFRGELDEFKIFNFALTQEEVLLVYNNLSIPTPTPTITPTPTPIPENWSSLNGSTLEDNLLVAGAPAGYTQGKVSMTSIPEGDGSDGIGMEIKLAPGQGAFISSLKEFDSPSLMHLSGQFKASNKEAAIALVGLNSPIDGQIGYTNVRSDEIPVDDYRQFNLIYAPPSGKVQYAIQAVNNPFSTISSTVWVDNIRVEPFEPIVGGEPVTLQVDGNFEGGLEELLININDDDGTVLPFFESITDIAIRMSLDPSNTAANLGTICLNLADQFPFRLLGQVSVKRDSLPGGGMTAMVLTNGYQNLGVFRNTDDLLDINSAQDDLLIIGGDFTINNPDIPISVFVQVGGPDANVSVVVDDLFLLKSSTDVSPIPIAWPNAVIIPTPTYSLKPTSIPIPTPTPTVMSTLTVTLPDLLDGAKSLEMVLIPAGTYMMGSPSDEQDRDLDETQHEVMLTSDFYIGKYEITQAQYKAVMGSNPANAFGVDPDHPVYYVSWYDAATFCNRLSEFQGLQLVYTERGDWPADWSANGFRLPTEAEWEYACRAGTQMMFYWGDDPNYTEIDDYAWYDGNCPYGTDEYGTKEVGLLIPNAFGLYDMGGNVYEWCHDWYGNYPSESQIDPTGAGNGHDRVKRGGCFHVSASSCRSANRDIREPDYLKDVGLGFRIVRLKTNKN